MRLNANCSGSKSSPLYLFRSHDSVHRRSMNVEAAPATQPRVRQGEGAWRAWGYTITGVLCFSLGFPMTKLALAAFEPVTVMLARGLGAGILAAVIVWVTRMEAAPGPARPTRDDPRRVLLRSRPHRRDPLDPPHDARPAPARLRHPRRRPLPVTARLNVTLSHRVTLSLSKGAPRVPSCACDHPSTSSG